MFSHVMVGTNDLAASKKFYDAMLGAIGISAGVVGDFDLKKQIRGKQFLVGQWQDGEFYGIESADLWRS